MQPRHLGLLMGTNPLLHCVQRQPEGIGGFPNWKFSTTIHFKISDWSDGVQE